MGHKRGFTSSVILYVYSELLNFFLTLCHFNKISWNKLNCGSFPPLANVIVYSMLKAHDGAGRLN